jgi:hypothetical protein
VKRRNLGSDRACMEPLSCRGVWRGRGGWGELKRSRLVATVSKTLAQWGGTAEREGGHTLDATPEPSPSALRRDTGDWGLFLSFLVGEI